jgi:hypothetical protein
VNKSGLASIRATCDDNTNGSYLTFDVDYNNCSVKMTTSDTPEYAWRIREIEGKKGVYAIKYNNLVQGITGGKTCPNFYIGVNKCSIKIIKEEGDNIYWKFVKSKPPPPPPPPPPPTCGPGISYGPCASGLECCFSSTAYTTRACKDLQEGEQWVLLPCMDIQLELYAYRGYKIKSEEE